MLTTLRRRLLLESYLYARALRAGDMLEMWHHGTARKALLWEIQQAKEGKA